MHLKNLFLATVTSLILVVGSTGAHAATRGLPTILVKESVMASNLQATGGKVSGKVGSFIAIDFSSAEKAASIAQSLRSQFGPQAVQQDMSWEVPDGNPNPWLSSSRLRVPHSQHQTINGTGNFTPYQWAFKMLGFAPRVWTGGKKVRVGVVDSGIDRRSDLDVKEYWSVENALTPSYVHATHVGGIVGADPRKGSVCGIAAGAAELYSADVGTHGGGMSDKTAAAGILHMVGKVDIINLSLGRPIFGQPSPVMEEAIRSATAAGILVVCAAGNDGKDQRGYIPCSYSLTNPMVVSVGALAPEGYYAMFSNYGTADCAPGVAMLSTVPKGYMAMSGTSMASPCWAAVAVLVKYHYPKLSWIQVVQRIRETGDHAVAGAGEIATYPNVPRALGLNVGGSILGYALNGTETTDAGSNLGGATLQISRNGRIMRRVITDASGYFNIPLEPGDYMVKVVKAGFVGEERVVRVGNSVVNLGHLDIYPIPVAGQFYVVFKNTTMDAALSEAVPAHTPVGTAFWVSTGEGQDRIGNFIFDNPGTPLDGPVWVRRSGFLDNVSVSTFGFNRGNGSIVLKVRNLYYTLTDSMGAIYQAGTSYADSGLDALLITGTSISHYRPTTTSNDVMDATWSLVVDTDNIKVTPGDLELPPPPPVDPPSDGF